MQVLDTEDNTTTLIKLEIGESALITNLEDGSLHLILPDFESDEQEVSTLTQLLSVCALRSTDPEFVNEQLEWMEAQKN